MFISQALENTLLSVSKDTKINANLPFDESASSMFKTVDPRY
jgi:hypothetical protein